MALFAVLKIPAGMSDSTLDADQLGLAATTAVTASSLNAMSAGLITPAMADLLPGLAGLSVSQDHTAGIGRPVVQAGSGPASANAVGGLLTQSSVSSEHGVASLTGRTLSRNSYSPMSDSGISVDAASSGSIAAAGASQAFNAALSKFIPPLSASSHGECYMFAGKFCPFTSKSVSK